MKRHWVIAHLSFAIAAHGDTAEYLEDAQDLLDMVRRREPAEEVLARLRKMASVSPGDPIPAAYCEVATQVLLELGKGAFAHHLRVLERYLAVFKTMASNAEDRQQLLASSVDFWQHNVQQQVIVFGKFHFYSILDASDIVTFVFTRLNASAEDIEDGRETSWTSGQAWDLLKVALEQQFGFAIGSRRKAHRLAAEDGETKARRVALGKEAEDDDAMALGEQIPTPTAVTSADRSRVDADPSQAARTASSNAARLRRDLDTVLLHTTVCFIKSLVPAYFAGDEHAVTTSRLEDLLALEAGEEVDERTTWDTRARLGWFREFLRAVSRRGSLLRSALLTHLSQYARPLKRIASQVEALLEALPRADSARADMKDWRIESGHAVRSHWEKVVGRL